MPLTPALEAEISALAQRYGPPRRVVIDLSDGSFDPVANPNRIGEVCMVIRRPSGHLLTAIKTFYPRGAFRLLTGGVKDGEPIEAALLREVQEETSLAVTIRRFLAIIEYNTKPPSPAGRTFATFAFLLDEIGGVLGVQDADEELEAFREVLPEELLAIADFLEHIDEGDSPKIGGRWQSWGTFRAIVHRAVYATLVDTGNLSPIAHP
jgi:8-oxo-dGTP pyrophosphatase MutT (NUDIX family)